MRYLDLEADYKLTLCLNSKKYSDIEDCQGVFLCEDKWVEFYNNKGKFDMKFFNFRYEAIDWLDELNLEWVVDVS